MPKEPRKSLELGKVELPVLSTYSTSGYISPWNFSVMDLAFQVMTNWGVVG